ncbi:unnamed protein product [Adineta steineri]|nr:unnamed protein product [Adineta steineri]
MTPYLFNQIWNLPKLTYLNLEICNVSDAIFSQLKTVSSTLESLCIQNGIPHPLRDIADLYQKAPNLRVLSMNINLKNEYEKFPVVVTSIMTLKLDFCGELRALHKLFQNLPNLCHLTIDMQDHYLTGHEWKQIIIDHLPKLKQLRFKMFIAPRYDTIIEEEIDELLNTFRTQFWLDERHWYVRCDWNPIAGSRTFGYLYTLSYAFRLFTGIAKGLRRSKWTSLMTKSIVYLIVYIISIAWSR